MENVAPQDKTIISITHGVQLRIKSEDEDDNGVAFNLLIHLFDMSMFFASST